MVVFVVEESDHDPRGTVFWNVVGVFYSNELAQEYITTLTEYPSMFRVKESVVHKSLNRFIAINRDKLRQTAYDKLNPAERLALGLTGD